MNTFTFFKDIFLLQSLAYKSPALPLSNVSSYRYNIYIYIKLYYKRNTKIISCVTFRFGDCVEGIQSRVVEVVTINHDAPNSDTFQLEQLDYGHLYKVRYPCTSLSLTSTLTFNL